MMDAKLVGELKEAIADLHSEIERQCDGKPFHFSRELFSGVIAMYTCCHVPQQHRDLYIDGIIDTLFDARHFINEYDDETSE